MDPHPSSRDLHQHGPIQDVEARVNEVNVAEAAPLPISAPSSPKAAHVQPSPQQDGHQLPSELSDNTIRVLERTSRHNQPYSFSNASVLRIPETAHAVMPASSTPSVLMPSNTTEKTASSQTSSAFGSFFSKKHHRRRSSSVFGWDSDDDDELNRTPANNTNTHAESSQSSSSSSSSSHTATNQADAQAVVGEKSPWLEREHGKQKKVRTCLCLGVILCFLVLGTILVFTFKEQIFHHNGGPGSRLRKGGPTSGGSTGDEQLHESIEVAFHVNKTIALDPNLNKVFYGIDYTPRGSQEPDCKVNLGQVIEDIKIISQLTTRIRLYGMACRQTESVLKAIEYLDLPEMHVILTLWVDNNAASWEKQTRMFWNLIDNDLPMDASSMDNGSNNQQGANAGQPKIISKIAFRVLGLSVGNEVLFRNEDPARNREHVPLSVLTGYISEIREGLAVRASAAVTSSDPTTASLGRHLGQIPVFSSDLGRNAHHIVDQVDWVMSNIHPFFAYTSVEKAANWAFANFKTETVPAAAGKPAMISEVGWPSGPSTAKLGPAVPSIDNLQTFLDSWVCQANKQKIAYYYFEAFDEPWKSSINARESQWGLMTVDRKLKISIPTC